MKITNNLGILLLAFYLILSGLAAFINIGQLSLLLGILAIAAGVLLLLGR